MAPKVLLSLVVVVASCGVTEVEVELAMVEVPNTVVIGEVRVMKPVEVGTVVMKVPLPPPVIVVLPTAVVVVVVRIAVLVSVTESVIVAVTVSCLLEVRIAVVVISTMVVGESVLEGQLTEGLAIA